MPDSEAEFIEPVDPIKVYARGVFEELIEPLKDLKKAAKKMRYDRAQKAFNAISHIETVLTDRIGEHLGDCLFCNEPLFEDEAETVSDEGEQAHADCALKHGIK